MLSLESIFLVSVVFVIAGFVKGVIGLGLPTVSLALLAATIELKTALAVLVLPALATNVVQALTGGALLKIVRRTWTFMVFASVFTWLGTGILAASDAPAFAALLGFVTVAYAGISLASLQIVISKKWEVLVSPGLGVIAGIITGLTGTFVVPGVMYLQSLKFSKDKFIQAMGILFTAASLALGISLGGHGLITVNLGFVSAMAIAPAFFGMYIGTKIRNKLDDRKFRRVFFISLMLLGIYIVVRSITINVTPMTTALHVFG